jgi:hypothetical protein
MLLTRPPAESEPHAFARGVLGAGAGIRLLSGSPARRRHLPHAPAAVHALGAHQAGGRGVGAFILVN